MAAGDAQSPQQAQQSSHEHEHEHEHPPEQGAAEPSPSQALADARERAARVLSPLAALDYRFMADRQRPGSPHTPVDMVVVGDAGVYIVDTKAWSEVRVAHGRVYQGESDEPEDLSNLERLVGLTEDAVAEVGLVPGEVHGIVVLTGMRNVDEAVGPLRMVGERDVLPAILERSRRLTPRMVEQVHQRLTSLFPIAGDPPPVTGEIRLPTAEQLALAQAAAQDGTQDATPGATQEPSPDTESDHDLDIDVDKLLRNAMMRKPIEEWMTWLDPEQMRAVRRSFNGPARIRGAAGTGKTVVGLHRAAHLAKTKGGPVLVTTLAHTLPNVMSNLLDQMAPKLHGEVEFTNVNEWAARFIASRGITYTLDPAQFNAAWREAWREYGEPSILGNAARDDQYWHDELDYVIKGRGLRDFAQYAELQRTGRHYPMNVDQRRAMWEVYRAYEDKLTARDLVDYHDLVLVAEQELSRTPLERPYTAVIVDEAQDMTCAMVRLMFALGGDGDDAFTLIGDGQQSVYPGGYTLSEAGVSVAGRGVVMDTNYRNTQQILTFARSVVADSVVADIEGDVVAGDVSQEAKREGPKPVVARCVDINDRRAKVVARVRTAREDVQVGPGDIGVLCFSKGEAKVIQTLLEETGQPAVNLEDYDGKPVAAVKVGTVKRAKGLEFKQVILADVSMELLGGTTPPQDPAEREHWDLEHRELYVAMTRARDGLWVGVV